MKNYLLGGLLLLIGNALYSPLQGQAIHDALALRKYVNDADGTFNLSNPDQLYAILSHYAIGATGATQIKAHYSNNPFLKDMVTTLDEMATKDNRSNNQYLSSSRSSGAASTGFGLSPSTFLLGLTDFLVGRTKQELNIAFFQDLQKVLETNEEMQYLFPTTKQVLLNMGTEVYQFKAYWEDLREAFLKDLDNLLYNLDDYVQESDHIKSELVRHIVSDLFKVTELLYNKTAPTKVVQYLATDAYLQAIDTNHLPNNERTEKNLKLLNNLKGTLQLVGQLSSSLHGIGENTYWVDQDKMVELLRDDVSARLYLGLLYEKVKDIKIDNKTVGDLLKPYSNNISKGYQLLNELKLFLREAGRLKRIVDEIAQYDLQKRKSKTAPTALDLKNEHQRYHDFAKGVLDLILYADDFKQIITGGESPLDSILTRYLSIANDLNTIVLEVRRQEYAPALMHALFVVEKVLPDDGQFTCARQELMRYGTFIATAVGAQTPKEVSNAIAAFALPPGSAALKKRANFSIMFNAFVGLSGGGEYLNKNTPPIRPYYAIATPIGVTFNWGLGKSKYNLPDAVGNRGRYGAFGIMVSLIDVGALTAFRFEDDKTNDFPDLKFENVFAPGLYAVYSVPKYPIAIGIGGQLGPNLRSITDNNLVVDQTSGFRFGAFLAVDIPIVSFYSVGPVYTRCQKNQDKADRAAEKAYKKAQRAAKNNAQAAPNDHSTKGG